MMFHPRFASATLLFRNRPTPKGLRLSLCIVLVILALAPPFLSAQQTMPPFVSRLIARTEGATIRLTWQDAPEEVPSYRIYRYTEEITTENLGDATLAGTAEIGEMTFVDTPGDTADYYYAVAAVDEAGESATVFIPYRNKTTLPAAVDAAALEASRPVTVRDLEATATTDEIILRYTTSNAKRQISVYRGTDPIESTQDLLSSVLIDTVSSSLTEFRDAPVAGLDYYYALFDTELLRVGKQEYRSGENVLASPVRISLPPGARDQVAAGTVRNRPLPFLVLSTKLESGDELSAARRSLDAPKVELSQLAESSIRRIVADAPQPTQPLAAPVILDPDRPVGDDENRTELSRIVVPRFQEETWQRAREVLESHLLTRRSDEVTRRARFYIGQTLYFEGRYREAFVQFLYSAEGYYAASVVWLDSILALLADQ